MDDQMHGQVREFSGGITHQKTKPYEFQGQANQTIEAKSMPY
jgi:hypothetical protein